MFKYNIHIASFKESSKSNLPSSNVRNWFNKKSAQHLKSSNLAIIYAYNYTEKIICFFQINMSFILYSPISITKNALCYIQAFF